ncbi:MAG: hypothetical protein IPJ77_03655 [Planctomycetes bacterium]|nr:hypothetical protein [Planctomycetota bacterium]
MLPHDPSNAPRALRSDPGPAAGAVRYLSGRAGLFAFLLALPVFLACAARYAFTCDDAFISFRYARHLAEGAGLAFNRGEAPPVEGFSNLLWVLWTSPWIALGMDPALVANATSIACGAALVGLVARLASRRWKLGFVPSAGAALFLATLPTFTAWSTSGLETLPFALAVFAVFERLVVVPGRPRVVGAVLALVLASLLRADGAAWALVSALAAGLATPAESRAAWRRAVLVVVAVLALVLVALGAWRYATFGELLPNTARVKAGLSELRLERGAKYVLTWCLTLPGALAALLLGVVGARAGAMHDAAAAGHDAAAAGTRRGSCGRGAVAAGAAMTPVALAYSVWTGGDFMPYGRFLVPATPFLALALAAGLGGFEARAAAGAGRALGGRLAALGVLALSVAATFGVVPIPDGAREALHFRWNEARSKSELDAWRGMKERAEAWRALGRALVYCTRPNESIVLGNIGAIGYETELWIHDQFGLVDREVARRDAPLTRASPGHDKGVGIDFFLARKPDYLGAWAWRKGEPDPGVPPLLDALVRTGRATIEDQELAPSPTLPHALLVRLVRYHAER